MPEQLETMLAAVKAVGDWELDVLAIPFGVKDSDGQWFDENTEIMDGHFERPLVLYQHGVKQGAKDFEARPLVLGEVAPGSLTKQSDGWHVRVILNKAIKQARDVMDAAWKRLVAVSSDSISHLARLDVGGRIIMYEKNRAGRVAVWPFAGISLWEMGNGNFRPSSRKAYALPAMKAIYREAGLPFPDVSDVTDGVLPDVHETAKRARSKEIQDKAKLLLKRTQRYEEKQ